MSFSWGPYAVTFEGIFDLEAVPELNLPPLIKNTGYIDFIVPEHLTGPCSPALRALLHICLPLPRDVIELIADWKSTTYPVMKFVDAYDRPGFALLLEAVQDDDVCDGTRFRGQVQKGQQWVLSPFQRYTHFTGDREEKRTWSYGWGNSEQKLDWYWNVTHLVETCEAAAPRWPGRLFHPLCLRKILLDQHPVIKVPRDC